MGRLRWPFFPVRPVLSVTTAIDLKNVKADMAIKTKMVLGFFLLVICFHISGSDNMNQSRPQCRTSGPVLMPQ